MTHARRMYIYVVTIVFMLCFPCHVFVSAVLALRCSPLVVYFVTMILAGALSCIPWWCNILREIHSRETLQCCVICITEGIYTLTYLAQENIRNIVVYPHSGYQDYNWVRTCIFHRPLSRSWVKYYGYRNISASVRREFDDPSFPLYLRVRMSVVIIY